MTTCRKRHSSYKNLWENPPVHVNIVGDASGSYDIPTWSESYSGYNGEGDYPYTTLEGNDVFPVFICIIDIVF